MARLAHTGMPHFIFATKDGDMLTLICEDDPIIAKDMFDEIAAAGLTAVGPARNGAEAVAAAEAHSPSIAVVDLTLEDGRSGIAVARELYRRGIAIIIYSGGLLSPEELSEVGHMFLRKPAPPGAIVECIRAATRRRSIAENDDAAGLVKGNGFRPN